MNKKGAKIIASMLVFVMMFTYMSIAAEVIATGVSTLTNNENVEFDAYLKDGETKTYAAIKTIGEENYLYANVIVKNAGYLKNASITFENPNFALDKEYTSDTVAKVEDNKITLNQIKNGETVELAIPVDFKETELVSQEDMKILNKFIVNRIAGILETIKKDEWIKLGLLLKDYSFFGRGWDKPIPDTEELEYSYDKMFTN